MLARSSKARGYKWKNKAGSALLKSRFFNIQLAKKNTDSYNHAVIRDVAQPGQRAPFGSARSWVQIPPSRQAKTADTIESQRFSCYGVSAWSSWVNDASRQIRPPTVIHRLMSIRPSSTLPIGRSALELSISFP